MELLTAQSANRLCGPIELSVVYRENQGFWGTTAPDLVNSFLNYIQILFSRDVVECSVGIGDLVIAAIPGCRS